MANHQGMHKNLFIPTKRAHLLSVGSMETLLYTSKLIPLLCNELTIVFIPGRAMTFLSVITHRFFTLRFAKS